MFKKFILCLFGSTAILLTAQSVNDAVYISKTNKSIDKPIKEPKTK